ncbi:MAG: hypothetical protein A2339_07975 [Elusimicrobia bacterium RIFOXYB12_FULL_50_12]|nr:MAG: hypothetical protein A2278_02750 [Elusimicrobia bacterium RIFOXYA12_FULL_49_49]OGS16400.1 MAG: hypothetical protein A2251_06205 [Elusimicrobia bacterium RIFOXYA2_FULL_47_53]OGS27223.1 MAG: hypothetical protein A2339_07975 [Elusimicrobia bacterium RIFOXYB12_FULL_50_12]OGS30423.1 MAG: hypothetical protein A2323_02835 [Elusimicrobia bacterium RIFOXYB2_FULL_46_23]
MDKVEIAVIGAGAAGLAAALKLSSSGKEVLLLEKNESYGRETSSRSSEVIHSGLYYPQNSLKASLCVRGNSLIYSYCRKKRIPFKNTGKIVAASGNSELEQLADLMRSGSKNGVKGLRLLSTAELRSLEPDINSAGGLFVPSTGIMDSHSLMKSLYSEFRASGGLAVFNCEVTGIQKSGKGGYEIKSSGDSYSFLAGKLINCAGLGSERIARAAGIDTVKADYRLHFCKGDYYRIKKRFAVSRLIYPVPAPELHNLGVHLTTGLSGGLRLGPNAYYVDSIDYSFGTKDSSVFLSSAKTFLPGLEPGDLCPDTSGIRPKLQGPGEAFRDFVIKDESDKGLPGLINLTGIESPGLTSCLAIAEYIEQIL